MFPGDFFSFLMILCYCVLHMLRRFVHWNCCVEDMCSHLQLLPEGRQWHCNGSVRRVNGVLAEDFFAFGNDVFPLKIPFAKCFEIVLFPLWRRDPALELQMAAIWGTAGVILLCFASQCEQIAVEWLRQSSSFLQLHASNSCSVLQLRVANRWPQLRILHVGFDFNQSLAAANMPCQLETLVRFFQHDLLYVPLRQTLLRLSLGECFPLERHPPLWPPCLEELLASSNRCAAFQLTWLFRTPWSSWIAMSVATVLLR